MSEADKIRWNQKYRNKGLAAFSQLPSAWLQSHETLIQKQPKGLALDLACGNGRNAFYLAGLGFAVEAVDIAKPAIDWVSQRTVELKLPVRPKLMDLDQIALSPDHYQIILNFNFLDRRLFPLLEAALVYGGLLIFETFNRDQITKLGSDIPTGYTLEKGELLTAFPSLQILDYREGIAADVPGAGARSVASLVARKLSG